ncbi:PP2C family protein-serine/threonine phosphatase [Rubrivirga sp. S365]|uniref:PP2C family protein-serine/threonine phosphatase n=1 Tax=Rubrivirga sp. S365 TaxID=3076080 RepID=UPI0028CA7C20|nr:PP2C family protein-serine/threonine phosphatase [Rubrivirga sp. S365]MDT7857847.1 PP2C family protein-serine/threonine phosphatase [Rubrivirga sp. S365]
MRVVEAAAHTPPPFGVAVALDLAVVVALAAAYAALVAAGAGRPPSLRTLSTPLLVALGVLAVEAGVGWLHEGGVDPKTALPLDLATAVLGGVVGAADGVLSVTVLVALRPLVLRRPRRGVVLAWRALVGLGLATAVLLAGRPVTELPPPALSLLTAATVLLGAALSARQSWTAALGRRQRGAAAALALALAAVLVGLVVVRSAGPATLPVGDGSGAVGAIGYTSLLSRPLGAGTLLVTVVGGLYALAAGLVLLLGAPAAEDDRTGERRALRQLADLSGRLLDRPALAAAVARGPVEAGLGDLAWVALSDVRTGAVAPAVVAAEGVSVEAAAAAVDVAALARAVEDGEALLLDHAEADHRVRARPGSGVGSLAVLPLGTARQASGSSPPDAADGGGAVGLVRGALFVARPTADAFAPDDLAALETFAGQAALSISHADLFADALERDRLARELTLAREVQRRLFPQAIPDVAGVQIAAAERPAREVGGDYYDVVRLGPACLGVLVADVSGKGAAAAFYMAMMKGTFQAGSRLARAPGAYLAEANAALGPSLGRGDFVSAAYAVLDADAETLALARAGHTPTVLARDEARPDGGTWLLRGDGLAIGLDREGATFRRALVEQTVALAPGDTLLLYTDGLVEARDAGGAEYGYDRLAAFVARHRDRDADTLRDLLLDEHRTWSGADPDDDTTFVVVRWVGRGGPTPAPAPAAPPVTERPAFPTPPAP